MATLTTRLPKAYLIAAMMIAGCGLVTAKDAAPVAPGAASNTAIPQAPSATIAAAAQTAAIAAQVAPQTPQAHYMQRCAICHGDTGKGDGAAAHLLFPKPRDFTTGVYRFKSTAGAELPAKEDLRRIIGEGIDRTAMPGFTGVLTNEQIDALGDYLLTLQSAQDPKAPRKPIDVPPRPKFDADLIAQGKIAFVGTGCALCHGETGKGDGSASHQLKDSGGYPLPPADFTKGVYKAGRTSEALYRAVMVGVPGTPMPGFADALKQGIKIEGLKKETDPVWAMVAYMESLAVKREAVGAAAGAMVQVETAADVSALADPAHAGWSKAAATAVSVRPLWQRREAARSVEVRAASDGQRVAVALSWPDATFDATGTSVHQFQDAASVMFGLGDQAPALTMGLRLPGQRAPEAVVNLWHWRADRQLNADKKQLHDAPGDDAAGGYPSDLYHFKTGDFIRGPMTEHSRDFISAWAAGNPKADPALMGRSVLESNAAGFGSLTQQPAAEQSVDGRAIWSSGRWQVVMIRALKATGQGDVQLADRLVPIPLAVAVWEGGAGDRDGLKLVSGWHWLKFGK